MTDIFRQYFLRKLIIWGGAGIIALLIRYLSKPGTSPLFAIVVILCFLVIGTIYGYIDYHFYEKAAPKIISDLLGKPPLSDFQAIGFIKEEEIKIGGYINNYNVFLAPMTNNEGEKWLIVLIPLQIREGLDIYFERFDNTFKFEFSKNALFAEAILKNYDKLYDFRKLVALLESTTSNLIDKQIMPSSIADK